MGNGLWNDGPWHHLEEGATILLISYLSPPHIFQPINLFIAKADVIYGPITTLRKDGKLVKHIPWSAFQIDDAGWEHIADCRAILQVRSLFIMRTIC